MVKIEIEPGVRSRAAKGASRNRIRSQLRLSALLTRLTSFGYDLAYREFEMPLIRARVRH